MDFQIIEALFNACIRSAELIERDHSFRKELADALQRIPKPQIGKNGQIQEWMEDYEEVEPGHRHISHLFGLYPGECFTPAQTPELTKAARVTLERRLENGGGHTGWSRAWIIHFWARLEDGEMAYENVRACWSTQRCLIFLTITHRFRLTATLVELRELPRCYCRVTLT
jgi:alpha-L-fucosidase 2